MTFLQKTLSPVYHLFFTNNCEACGNELVNRERIACTSCMYSLAKTNFHRMINNPFEQKFWGRVAIENGTAMYYFNKGNTLQHLLHALKYRGKEDTGLMLGRLFARTLEEQSWLKEIDLVMPVPLSKQKLRSRGFNQSEIIARGFSQYLRLNINTTSVIRVKNTETQTSKTRSERIENVHQAFAIGNPSALEHKHILLLDDVITTGATLESCAQTLLLIPGARVSMVTLGYAVE